MGCPVAFTLEQLGLNAKSMIAAAGFESFAEGVNQSALSEGVSQVAAAVEAEPAAD